jgi:hypothetical protein
MAGVGCKGESISNKIITIAGGIFTVLYIPLRIVVVTPFALMTNKKKAAALLQRLSVGVPKGSRTPVVAVKGRCPRPLDDGDKNLLFVVPFYGVDITERGGARRDRTADLLHAMQALSQLSYSPEGRRVF